jgi:hypothetical protein
MKSSIFSDITPCNPLKVNRRFGGICCLHLLSRASACHLLSRWFLAWLIPQPWRWRRHVPPKRRLTFNGLHGVISKKTELFRFFILTILSSGIWRHMVRRFALFKKMLILPHRQLTKIENYRLGTAVDHHLKNLKDYHFCCIWKPLVFRVL